MNGPSKSKLRFSTIIFKVIFTLFISIIPFLYQLRIESKIFQYDYYAIWILAGICLLFTFPDIKRKRLSKAAIAFIIYLLILCISKRNIGDNSIYGLLTWLSFFVIFFAVVSSQLTLSDLAPAVFISLSIQIIFTLKQAIDHNWQTNSIVGTFTNSGYFGLYLCCILPIAVGFTIFNARGLWKITYLVVVSIATVLLLCTLSRAAILGFLSSIILFILHYKVINWRKRSTLFLLAASILTTLTFAFLVKTNSALGRLIIYNVTLETWKQNPFFGVGLNNFSAHYNESQADYFAKKNNFDSAEILANETFEAFNIVLQVMAEYGLVGLVLLTLIAVALLNETRLKFKEGSILTKGAIGSIVAVLVSSLFANPFHCLPIALFFCSLFALLVQPNNTSHNTRAPKRLLAILVVGSTLAFVIVRVSLENKWWYANKYYGAGQIEKADTLFKSCMKGLKNNGEFLYNYGAFSAVNSRYELASHLINRSKVYVVGYGTYIYLGDSYLGMGEVYKAEAYYRKAINMVPARIYGKYQLISLYQQLGRMNDACSMINKALAYPLKVRSDLSVYYYDKIKILKSKCNIESPN